MSEPEGELIIELSDLPSYPVRPHDIYVGDGCLLSTFGSNEVEREAERLVRFFQHKSYWCRFTLYDVTHFYREQGWEVKNALCGLAWDWFHDASGWLPPAKRFIAMDAEGFYCVTSLFIERCMIAHDPAAFLQLVDQIAKLIGEKYGRHIKT